MDFSNSKAENKPTYLRTENFVKFPNKTVEKNEPISYEGNFSCYKFAAY